MSYYQEFTVKFQKHCKICKETFSTPDNREVLCDICEWKDELEAYRKKLKRAKNED